MAMEQTHKVFTVDELAGYLRIHRSTIYRLLKRHAIPGFKIGSDWRFNFEDIELWVDGRQKESLAELRESTPAPAAPPGRRRR